MEGTKGLELLLDSLGIPPEIRQHADRGWLLRAILDPAAINNPDGSKSSVRTATSTGEVGDINKPETLKTRTFLYPTIRKQPDGSLKQLGGREAQDVAFREKRDAITVPEGQDGDALSRLLSSFLGSESMRAFKGGQ